MHADAHVHMAVWTWNPARAAACSLPRKVSTGIGKDIVPTGNVEVRKVMAHKVMVYIDMTDIVMADIVMADIVMALIVMADILMADILMADILTARTLCPAATSRYAHTNAHKCRHMRMRSCLP